MHRTLRQSDNLHPVVAILAVLLLVGIGFGIYSQVRTHGSVEGTVVETTYEPNYKYFQPAGRVTIPKERERWTADLDTNGDGQVDRTVEINEQEYSTLSPGDVFSR